MLRSERLTQPISLCALALISLWSHDPHFAEFEFRAKHDLAISHVRGLPRFPGKLVALKTTQLQNQPPPGVSLVVEGFQSQNKKCG